MSTAETMVRLNWFLIIFDRRKRQLVSIVEYGCTSCDEATLALCDASEVKAKHIEIELIAARSLESLEYGYPRFFWDQPPLTPVPHCWADTGPDIKQLVGP